MASNKLPLATRITNFLRRIEGKASRTLRSSYYYGIEQYHYPVEDYENFAKEGYCHNADVFACIYLKQQAVGGIPLHVFGLKPDGTRDDKLPKHPLALLLKRPNPYQGYSRFIGECVGYLDISGNCYIEGVNGDTGKPGSKPLTKPPNELYSLRPDKIDVKGGDTQKKVANYRFAGDMPLPENSVLHLKRFHPADDWYGLSPLSPGEAPISQNNAADDWNFQLFKNYGRPGGWITTEDEVSDNEYDKVMQRIRERLIGPKNAGNVGFLTGGLDWKPDSLAPKDMDFMNMRRDNTRRTCSLLGVPSQLIGDEQAKTYANYAEARQAFYQETILPLLDWLVDELNNWLVPLYGGNIEIGYDLDEIEALQEDRTAQVQRELLKLTSGEATLNETRETLGDDNLGPDGEVLYIPQGLLPTPVDEIRLALPPEEKKPNAQSEGQPPGEATKEQSKQPQPVPA